jgi:C-terminal processing protease CtpA/Prc
MYWASDRHGARMQAGWAAERDVYAAFFDDDAWERFQLNPAEYEQWKAKEKKDDAKEESSDCEPSDEEGEEQEGDESEPIEIELEGLEDREVRLTMHSADLADARVTPDGETLLYLAAFEQGYDLWAHEHREKEVKRLAKLGAKSAGSLHVDASGKKGFLLADKKLVSIDLASGKVSPVALQARMQLDRDRERAYLFEHIWRQTREKFYVKDMHGVDWEKLKQEYAKFLPHIDNNWDFAEMISEMQGELNASHTGCRHRPKRPTATKTGSLAFFPDPDHEGPGVKIAEVIPGGPLELTEREIEPGTIIEAIDGEAIGAGENWYPLLDHKAGQLVRLSLRDPDADEAWEETFKPLPPRALQGLLYERWVRGRRAEVERLSDGRLGYAHIRGMSDGPYRKIIEDIFGLAAGKEGLVLDTRFNGGGNLVEALTVFLSGEQYFEMVPRGRKVGISPRGRWTKPSIVVMNEGNYSDAHCFPVAYTSLDIGETVGMQVPGTCTSVWWERLQDPSLIFGIPQIAHVDNEGDITENKHLDPDHEVDNDPALEAKGRDQQLEKAVEVLLDELDG